MSAYSRIFGVISFALLIAIAAFFIPSAAKPVLAYTPVTIDHFEVSQSLTQNGVGTTSSTADGSTSTLIGGERDMILNYVSGTGTSVATSANSPASRFSHNPDAAVNAISTLIYDGDDNNATTLSFGLNANLRPNSEDAIVIGLEQLDYSSRFTITLYTTDATHCSQYGYLVPAHNPNLPATAIVFKYSNFTTPSGCTGGGATYTDVDAIVIELDTTRTAGTDIIIHLVESTRFDFGDLPSVYGITVWSDGDPAFHTKNNDLYLGTLWDNETDGQPDANAKGDDQNGDDDEDGVSWYGPKVSDWNTSGKTVTVTVKVVGDGCLSAWIDWAHNSTFGNYATNGSNKDWVIVHDQVITGSKTYTLTVPSTVSSSGAHPARFRLTPRNTNGQCPTTDDASVMIMPTGSIAGGEVEDYLFGSDTTAVSLQSFVARVDEPDLFASLSFIGFVGVVGAAGLVFKRRR